MIHFVAHYVEIPEREKDEIRKKTGQTMDTPSQELMASMFASIKTFHPGCRMFLLTDHATNIVLPDYVEIILIEMGEEAVLAQRYSACLQFLETWNHKCNLIFLDWDILILENLAHLFDTSCDMILTLKYNSQWPINTGFIAIPKTCSANLLNLLRRMLFELRSNPDYQRCDWFGDQQFFNSLFLPLVFKNPKEVIEINHIKVRFIDGDRYNFTPSHPVGIHPYLFKSILHFTGNKKGAMLKIWQKIKES